MVYLQAFILFSPNLTSTDSPPQTSTDSPPHQPLFLLCGSLHLLLSTFVPHSMRYEQILLEKIFSEIIEDLVVGAQSVSGRNA